MELKLVALDRMVNAGYSLDGYHKYDSEDKKIHEILATGYRGSVVEIGAGIGTIAKIFMHANASKYLLEAISPYHQDKRNEYLGAKPKYPSVSKEIAELLAQAAYQKSKPLGGPIFGLAITGATATAWERRGQDHFYISVAGDDLPGITVHVVFKECIRDLQQKIAAEIGFAMLHQALVNKKKFSIAEVIGNLKEKVIVDQIWLGQETQHQHLVNNLKLIENGYSERIFFNKTEVSNIVDHLRDKKAVLLYKGSFNPITTGHLEVMREAEGKIKQHYKHLQDAEILKIFEISRTVVEKERLSSEQLAHVTTMIGLAGYQVLITNKALFKDLSLLFKTLKDIPVNFVAGFDTYKRIIDKKYYGSAEDRDQAVQVVTQNGKNKILVAPRFNSDTKEWHMLTDDHVNVIQLETKIKSSSTEVRQAASDGKPSKYLDPKIQKYIKKHHLYVG